MVKQEKPKSLKATVTHLEATSRPGPAPALPVNLHATLLRANRIPLHFYRYLQWRVGREWHWVYRLRMSDAELASVLHDPRTDIRVLSVDGAPVGFFELHKTDDTMTTLAYFGLMDHVRGRGLGRWMLGQALMTAWERPISRVTVSTNTLDHPGALQLYQRMGFQPISQNLAIVRPLSDAELIALARS